jgi:hypothetical protein
MFWHNGNFIVLVGRCVILKHFGYDSGRWFLQIIASAGDFPTGALRMRARNCV